MDKCRRCGGTSVTMSRFNTDMICEVCEDKERAHPDYSKAVEAELKALQGGNMNYPGIGRPADL